MERLNKKISKAVDRPVKVLQFILNSSVYLFTHCSFYYSTNPTFLQ